MFTNHIHLIYMYWPNVLPMARKTEIQSQMKSYQRHKKWYLIPPCLTLNTKRYISRAKWSNPGKGAVPTNNTPRCSNY